MFARRSRARSMNLTKRYRQRYQPAQRIIRTKLGPIDRHMNIRQPPDNSLERNLALQPGQGGPDTIVNTIPEPQGACRRAIDIQPFSIRKLRSVAVRCTDE